MSRTVVRTLNILVTISLRSHRKYNFFVLFFVYLYTNLSQIRHRLDGFDGRATGALRIQFTWFLYYRTGGLHGFMAMSLKDGNG